VTGWSTLNGAAPQIIAHRGASGQFPEHVLPGYQAALEQGADIIEPDLVMSRDGVLICRHDLGLARSTDIARRAEFAARRRDGDWWCWEFDAEELFALGAVQPFTARDQSLNGRFGPPGFAQAIDWAAHQARARGTAVLLYPELKHPSELAARGLDPVPAFVAEAAGRPPEVELMVQCFEPAPLRRVVESSGLPGMLLVDSRGDPQAALRRHADWLSGLALSKRWLLGADGAALVRQVHQAKLSVDAWTLRDDQPAEGFADVHSELRQLIEIGVDRLFCDFPATGVAVRAALVEKRYDQ
jgi:glycerophosphoryl diester phosphodiesterase